MIFPPWWGYGYFLELHNTYLRFFFSVIPCFILEGKDAGDDEHVFMMEAALNGKFEKYLGNDGTSTSQGLNSAHGNICLAFAHWTFQFTEEALVVTDLQGKFPWFTQILNYPFGRTEAHFR